SAWPAQLTASSPVRASHTLTVWSKLAEARRRPSGRKTTAVTAPWWPDRERIDWAGQGARAITASRAANRGVRRAIVSDSEGRGLAEVSRREEPDSFGDVPPDCQGRKAGLTGSPTLCDQRIATGTCFAQKRIME